MSLNSTSLFKFINKQPDFFTCHCLYNILAHKICRQQNLLVLSIAKRYTTEASKQQSMTLPEIPSSISLHTSQQALHCRGLCDIYSVKDLLPSLYLSASFCPSLTASLFQHTCFTKLQYRSEF